MVSDKPGNDYYLYSTSYCGVEFHMDEPESILAGWIDNLPS